MKDNGRILLCPPSLKSLKGYRLGNEKLYDKYKREWKERGRTNKGVNTPLNLISEKDSHIQVQYEHQFKDNDHFTFPYLRNWIEETVNELRKYTDRRIILRGKPPQRAVRNTTDRFVDALNDNIWATVTYNSIVAVESVMNGVPAFVMQENAALPVTLSDISKIEDPYFPTKKERLKWVAFLSHNQFTKLEMGKGIAFKTLKKIYG